MLTAANIGDDSHVITHISALFIRICSEHEEIGKDLIFTLVKVFKTKRFNVDYVYLARFFKQTLVTVFLNFSN